MMIRNVRKIKWSWEGHINNHLKDYPAMDLTCQQLDTIRQEKTTRDTSQAVERRPGQLLGDTIWQRTAQDRVTWRRHVEAFSQPRDTAAAQ